jgi:hypothetical protein
MGKRGRPPLENPRRERLVSFVREDEYRRIKNLLTRFYPRADSIAAALRECLLDWAERVERDPAPGEIKDFRKASKP